MMRSIDVQATRELCDRASRGSWRIATEGDDPRLVIADVGAVEILAPQLRLFDQDHDARADAEFIEGAGCPVVVRRMVDELEAERAMVDELADLVMFLAGRVTTPIDPRDVPVELRSALLRLGLMYRDSDTG